MYRIPAVIPAANGIQTRFEYGCGRTRRSVKKIAIRIHEITAQRIMNDLSRSEFVFVTEKYVPTKPPMIPMTDPMIPQIMMIQVLGLVCWVECSALSRDNAQVDRADSRLASV